MYNVNVINLDVNSVTILYHFMQNFCCLPCWQSDKGRQLATVNPRLSLA